VTTDGGGLQKPKHLTRAPLQVICRSKNFNGKKKTRFTRRPRSGVEVPPRQHFGDAIPTSDSSTLHPNYPLNPGKCTISLTKNTEGISRAKIPIKKHPQAAGSVPLASSFAGKGKTCARNAIFGMAARRGARECSENSPKYRRASDGQVPHEIQNQLV